MQLASFCVSRRREEVIRPPIDVWVDPVQFPICEEEITVTPVVLDGLTSEHRFRWVVVSGSPIIPLAGYNAFEFHFTYATSNRSDVNLRFIIDPGKSYEQSFDIVISGTPRSVYDYQGTTHELYDSDPYLHKILKYAAEFETVGTSGWHDIVSRLYVSSAALPTADINDQLVSAQLQKWHVGFKRWDVVYDSNNVNVFTPTVIPLGLYRIVSEYQVNQNSTIYRGEVWRAPGSAGLNRFLWDTHFGVPLTFSVLDSITINIPTLVVLDPQDQWFGVQVDENVDYYSVQQRIAQTLVDAYSAPTMTTSTYTITRFGTGSVGG